METFLFGISFPQLLLCVLFPLAIMNASQAFVACLSYLGLEISRYTTVRRVVVMRTDDDTDMHM